MYRVRPLGRTNPRLAEGAPWDEAMFLTTYVRGVLYLFLYREQGGKFMCTL